MLVGVLEILLVGVLDSRTSSLEGPGVSVLSDSVLAGPSDSSATSTGSSVLLVVL